MQGCRKKVLRYMGILTVMKLSVFAVSALSLLIALSWVLIYCPVGMVRNSAQMSKANTHDPRNRMELSDYFDHYEEQLDEDLKRMKPADLDEKQKGHKTMEKKGSSQEVEIPMQLYKDDAFEEMIRQLNKRDVKEYEFLAESMNVTIYRQPRGNAGLYHYKLYATLPDATPDQIAAVFLDNEYRVVWDNYVTELYPVQLNEKGPDVIYFNVDYPWPLTNRDYVYARETRKVIREGKEYIVIVMHSVKKHNVKEISGAIRVDDYHQSLALSLWNKRGTLAYIEYYDNPKGSIPSWLVNWAAKTGVPAFMKDLQRACAGLPGFLKDKGRPPVTIPVQ
ncbi:phosphatidylcholine transfer protein-like isoform X1 [Clavelina lepadiformis]|uniref:phosphatidylcholine transfer protein-like isoform X1 n=2 Tax=Clavelina lepadiformis TaxID=159417 RepID=UPI00404261A7